jgi:hypothetical protein
MAKQVHPELFAASSGWITHVNSFHDDTDRNAFAQPVVRGEWFAADMHIKLAEE